MKSNKKKISRLSVSRRGFLKAAAISAAAASGTNLLQNRQVDAGVDGYYPTANSHSPEFNFTEQSSALQPDAIVNSACQFCNSLCRLKVHLKQGRIIDVQGEPEDPVQAGGICVKGSMMTQLVYNRFRLTTPMKRVAGKKGDPNSQFEPISWQEALETIATKFLALRDAGEARAIANKTSGRLPRGTGTLVERLFTLIGSPNNTDVGPVCNDAGGNALAWTFGLGNFTNGYGKDGATGKEDLGSAKFLLFFGTNQAETHPVTFAYLLRNRAQTKAQLVVVDPRLTTYRGASRSVDCTQAPYRSSFSSRDALSHFGQEFTRQSLCSEMGAGLRRIKKSSTQTQLYAPVGRKCDWSGGRPNQATGRGLC